MHLPVAGHHYAVHEVPLLCIQQCTLMTRAMDSEGVKVRCQLNDSIVCGSNTEGRTMLGVHYMSDEMSFSILQMRISGAWG